ncbi:MAG: ATP-dependent helicase [Nitrospirae bacterium]|nr:ATP-dependent helicase [Nitrospirota bacterium]
MEANRYVLRRPSDLSVSPRYTIDYEKELNPAQYAAVTALDGPVLVIAGAGSGKTRTLVYRVARYIESGLPPENLLLLTFTRKAAQEMLSRAGLLLGTVCDRVAGGTFHSFSNMILRRRGTAIGLDPAFTILDRPDGEDAIHLLRNARGLGEREKRFPRKNTLSDMFSASVNKATALEEIVLTDYPHFSDHLGEILELEKAYADYKRQRSLLDYDDLLLKLQELLETQREVRGQLSETYRAIMVDEYQDTNKIQARVVRLLCANHENVMVVGDDAQSIYSFRGAHFKNIMDFPKEFPKARIFKLEENYRSTQPILNLTNEIINQAREKYPKHLFTHQKEGRPPVVVQAENENWQSRFVCQKVLELREEGVPLETIAVLFRSSHHSFDLEIELIKHGLPFVKRGGFKFIETTHVKDVLAHLRVLQNPRDAVSWNRLLLLIDGVGPKKSQSIIAAMAKETDMSAAGSQNAGWLKALKVQSEQKAGGSPLKEVTRLFDDLLAAPQLPSEQLNRIYSYYTPHLSQRFDDYPKRIKDLEHLYAITERYMKLDEFLSDITLEPPSEAVSEIEPTGREDEKLILSTIHSAKGLEWHTVFIIWALDGKFPSMYSFDSDEELEEERRLMYVAATRAQKGLYITYPVNVYDKVLGTVLSRQSRFLDGLPRSLYNTWSLVEEDM